MYRYIIFDLDGTLTDPGQGITNSLMYALNKFGIEEERSRLYKFIGPPLRESFRTYYGFSEEQAETAVGFYREYFDGRGIYENELYPGMYDLLYKLYAADSKLFVATSKPQQFAVRVLEYFSINKFFTAISGSNMDGSMSEKSLLIERLVPLIGIGNLTHTIMVGDRRFDIEGARYHGIDSVAVIYGYGEASELHGAKPTYIAESIEDLVKILL